MLATTAAPRPAVRPPAPVRREHLWEVDVVRLLTFAAVIAVHTLAFTEQPDNRVAAGAMMLLQFGREVFFALTGFVLVYSTAGRPLRSLSFWRKRMLYVAVPYVVWSLVYYAYNVLGPPHAPASASSLGWDLLYGSAEYHLYFLVVTLQLYLVFPLVSRFVRRTSGRALQVLAGVAVVNLAWMALVAYLPSPGGAPGWFWDHAYELLPTYSMYVLAGAYAALHLDRIQSLVRDRSGQLLKVAGGSALAALTVYAVQLPLMAPRTANQVIQPGMTFSCIAAVLVMYLAGTRWAAGERRRQETIERLSDASFGIYLAHPLVLLVLTDFLGFGNQAQRLPAPAATVMGLLITAGGSTILALAARRTPLSLALAGRPWRKGTRP